MILLLEICLLSFGLMASSEASIPPNARLHIEQLNNYYQKTTEGADLFDGKPLFWGRLDGFEKPEQKLLMTIILDAYNRILTQMQNETEDAEVQNKLIKVKVYLDRLKLHYFSDKHNKLKTQASEVMALKETDPLVQRKALFELIKVYHEADNLRDTSVQNHRSRRQAKASKKHRSKS
ncbi:interferon gamma 1 isoform X1 [Pygocentrus nattereri]|uniref:interferon gamma 1 isoform X1 n=1 Tax=Pygocentrus nattereri TaxID=42514 RepID=UPI001890F5D7|nr:interferon gamma 1 isoform X1 [Pygocentrus nattereri]